MESKRYKVRLNSIEKIEELLQEIYDQACRQLNEVQNEMNKLMNSSNLGADGVSMDEKAKYAKAMHDYIGDKSKAISSKFEIAKFMGEIVKHNGDANATVNDKNYAKRTSLNLSEIKSILDKDNDTNEVTYNIK
jgi:hypothetical protein